MSSYKILLVDDETTITQGLKAIIEKSSLDFSEIFVAADGREGMRILHTHKPDIVITDIMMPDIGGLDMIEKVNDEMQKRPVFIILSGYDDFKYAQKAIHCGVMEYLLKPVRKNELLQLLGMLVNRFDKEKNEVSIEASQEINLKEGVDVLREKYLNQILSSNTSDKGMVLEKLTAVGIPLQYDIYQILVLDFRKSSGSLEAALSDDEKYDIKSVIEAMAKKIVSNVQSFFDMKMRLVLLLGDVEEEKCRMLSAEISRTFRMRMAGNSGFIFFIGVGGCVKGVENIYQSYNQASVVLKHKITCLAESVAYFEESVGQNLVTDGIYIPLFIKITGEIELGKRSNLIMLLEEKFSQMKVERWTSVRLESFYNSLNSYIFDMFSRKYTGRLSAFRWGEKEFREFDSFWSIEQFESYVKRSLLDLCDSICSQKNRNSDTKFIEQFIAYIHNNYTKDISLNSISEYFGKSEGYLSMLFRKETGKSFIEYLTALRIEKAKELLAGTNLKIYEISKNVGYPNPKHFFIVFKKFMGISPLQYRNQCG